MEIHIQTAYKHTRLAGDGGNRSFQV